MQTGYNKLCDWWSLGVIMYEMLIGKTHNREVHEITWLQNQNRRCTNKPAVLRHHQCFLKKVVGSVQVTRPSAPRRRRRPTGR